MGTRRSIPKFRPTNTWTASQIDGSGDAPRGADLARLVSAVVPSFRVARSASSPSLPARIKASTTPKAHQRLGSLHDRFGRVRGSAHCADDRRRRSATVSANVAVCRQVRLPESSRSTPPAPSPKQRPLAVQAAACPFPEHPWRGRAPLPCLACSTRSPISHTANPECGRAYQGGGMSSSAQASQSVR